MEKNRVEAFSDGVIAIIITIMVLELKVPHGEHFSDLSELSPFFLAYVLSFIFVAIYWNNHHHTFQAVKKVDGKLLWSNNILLFFLSLIPFSTGWMAESYFGRDAVILYGINLIACAIAYTIMLFSLIRIHGPNSTLARVVGEDKKGTVSLGIYVLGTALAWVHPYISLAFFAVVSIMWIIPDRRIEKVLTD